VTKAVDPDALRTDLDALATDPDALRTDPDALRTDPDALATDLVAKRRVKKKRRKPPRKKQAGIKPPRTKQTSRKPPTKKQARRKLPRKKRAKNKKSRKNDRPQQITETDQSQIDEQQKQPSGGLSSEEAKFSCNLARNFLRDVCERTNNNMKQQNSKQEILK